MDKGVQTELLTQNEVADILKVSVGTVINYRKRGQLPYVRFYGSSRVLYPAEGVREALDQFSTKSKEDSKNKKTTETQRKKPVMSAVKAKEWRI